MVVTGFIVGQLLYACGQARGTHQPQLYACVQAWDTYQLELLYACVQAWGKETLATSVALHFSFEAGSH